MHEIEMLCLANSWKYGGRCVAGVQNDGSWIRPVSDTEDGSLNGNSCLMRGGRPVRVLDVVRLRVQSPDPRPHQPENWIVTDDEWVLLRSRNVHEVSEFLDSVTVQGPSLFGTTTERVTWSQIQESESNPSLALVKAQRPRFHWSQSNPTQRRASFALGGVSYDLPMTFEFELPAKGEANHRSQSSWYFTISLGEPFARQGNDCFKLIAGAIEIPSTE